MSYGSVAGMLADLIEPAALSAATPAKAANPANREQRRGLEGTFGVCERLRILRKPADEQQEFAGFAAVRKPQNGPQSEQRRGFSQVSQVSQGYHPTSTIATPLDMAAVAWTDAEIERFVERRNRLLRWGWSEPDAEALAERLVRRDRQHDDDRVSCIDCEHYRPGRCGNHRLASLHSREIGRDLAGLLQRCPGFTLAPGLT